MTTTLPPTTPLPPATTSPPTPDPGRTPRSDFGPLAKRVRAASLLEPRPDFYVSSALLSFGLVWLSVLLLITLQGTAWALLVAPLVAVASAQLAYLGHDIGHHQVIRGARWRWLAGATLANLVTGLSYGWWNDKHNRHHASPNVDGSDPDVADGIIAWSDRQAARRTGFGRWFARHQAKFFLPLLTLTGIGLRVAGLQNLRDRTGWKRVAEAVMLLSHIVITFGFLSWIGGWVFAVQFLVIMNLCWGFIMGMAFAPNHKGMLAPEQGERLDHLRKQVLTSRNLVGGRFVDWWYGGLNYQIEHHLFPSMPRPNLPAARHIVKDHCRKVGLPYHEVGLLDSYREILGHLDHVGGAAR
ncbi:fatty acid desaturase family protein [Microlunatus sp. Y2014]|uniref:fatty acid desaturase family protein n=1 Tax=Microlunatus sp. Y2014 TaxID=3418488 RepID=UPI003DA703B5